MGDWPSAGGGGGGGLKTANDGYFCVPTGPADGTTVNSGGAGTYGSWTELLASAGADLYIVGFVIDGPNASPGYCQVDIGTGAAASETSVGEWKVGTGNGNTNTAQMWNLFPYAIPVASGTRIAARVADGGTHNWEIALICINQADLEAIAA